MTRPLLLTALLAFTLPAVAGGQEAGAITTQAVGRVEVPPDHAVLSVGAMFRAETATEATDRLAATLAAILDTLESIGFDRDSMPTTSFSVSPRIDYETNRVEAYHAQGSVEVTIRDLEMTGALVDAAVAGGGNQLGALQFRLQDQRAARDSALALAVASARRDAEVLAAAAGGRLGGMVELSTIEPSGAGISRSLGPVLVSAARMEERAVVPVTPRSVVVQVSVTGRWTFLPD